jgi:pimeloyl-ACP methyl ester carboxylesterase
MSNAKVEPFKIAVSDDVLTDLRERLNRTRLPDEVPDTGWDYGTNLAYLTELVEYWRTKYDWRIHERVLNRFSHFKANIDGVDVHFIHQQGTGPNSKPLLLIHGWPGSIYEFNSVIPMLTRPSQPGASDSFTVIAPSLPGYGFSGHPTRRGFGVAQMAQSFHQLMAEVLGYKRYAVQGGDWGSAITSAIGYGHREHLYGIHVNMIGAAPAEGRGVSEPSDEEKGFFASAERFRHEEAGYQAIQGTKPQTLAYGLNDSPAGLAAWIVEKFRTWSDCKGSVERSFTKDQLLTNVMIYWVTESINSSTRLYYEQRHSPFRLAKGTRIETPTAIALFPGEILLPPRSWAERIYNIKRWTMMPRGGHFAAMEEPKLLADDIREFFCDLS